MYCFCNKYTLSLTYNFKIHIIHHLKTKNMKKITLLLSFIACVAFAHAQLLVSDNFNYLVGSGLLSNGWVGTGATPSTLSPILVTAGDGTDARVWSGLVTSASGVTPVVYYAVPTTHADSLITYIPIHGPGGNIVPASGTYGNDLNGYLLDNRTSAVWHTYNYSFKFPTGIAQFNFAVRQYTAATVIWDNFYFGPDTNAGFSSPNVDVLSVSLKGSTLSVDNAADGSTVDVYSTIGAKVQSAKLQNGAIQLNSFAKGLYIVRVGNLSSKIML